MRIISRRALRDHWELPGRGDSEEPLKTWFAIAKRAEWQSPHDVKAQWSNASIVGDNRVVFNIHGNTYRLVVKFNYKHGIGWIRFVGTHKEYDNIDVETV